MAQDLPLSELSLGHLRMFRLSFKKIPFWILIDLISTGLSIRTDPVSGKYLAEI